MNELCLIILLCLFENINFVFCDYRLILILELLLVEKEEINLMLSLEWYSDFVE